MKTKDNLQGCIKAAHRAKELVGQIVMFNRQTTPEPKLVDIASLTKEMARLPAHLAAVHD